MIRLNCLGSASKVALWLLASVSLVAGQNTRVEVGKHTTGIPKICEGVVAIPIEGKIDVAALLREAACKGAGDMLIDYTYVMKLTNRNKDDKGQFKEEVTTYEVYIPTLKSGMRARGVLLVTSRNGIPVPPHELEKARLKTGERLEKAENEIARRDGPKADLRAEQRQGMAPVGMYPRVGVNRAVFGFRRGGAVLNVHTFLRACEWTIVRHDQDNGREALVLSFTPNPGAQLAADENYIAQLRGEVWVDVKEHIVTRLIGWPAAGKTASDASPTLEKEEPPAVYLEMLRLPNGVWLPQKTRINGAEYPALFDHMSFDWTATYGEYKRFSTEIQDVRVQTPKVP